MVETERVITKDSSLSSSNECRVVIKAFGTSIHTVQELGTTSLGEAQVYNMPVRVKYSRRLGLTR